MNRSPKKGEQFVLSIKPCHIDERLSEVGSGPTGCGKNVERHVDTTPSPWLIILNRKI
jgi:hypothetical protein